MRFETEGAIPTRPDFDMLKAGFVAAQATTPTAQASTQAQPPVDRTEALIRLFGEGSIGLEWRDAGLQGSFHAVRSPDDTEESQR